MGKIDFGKLASKAKDVVGKSGDKIAAGANKVTDKIDEKTHGKYHDKLEKVDNLTAKLDKTKTAESAEAAEAGAAGAAEVVEPDAPTFPQPEPPAPPAAQTPAT
jgi:hypothetical protein